MEQIVTDVTPVWFVLPILLICFVAAVVIITHFLFRFTKRWIEISRKVVHVSSGVAFALGSFMMTKEQMIFSCVLMAGGLVAVSALRLPLIMESVPRVTIGAAAFPLGLAIATTLFYGHPDAFRFAVLALGICDTAAALCGTYMPLGRFKIFGQQKSLSGFLGCIVSAYVLAVLCGFDLLSAFLVALAIALTESLFVFGLDNLFVPVVAGGLFYLFM
jgi:dolichol kinase